MDIIYIHERSIRRPTLRRLLLSTFIVFNLWISFGLIFYAAFSDRPGTFFLIGFGYLVSMILWAPLYLIRRR